MDMIEITIAVVWDTAIVSWGHVPVRLLGTTDFRTTSISSTGKRFGY